MGLLLRLWVASLLGQSTLFINFFWWCVIRHDQSLVHIVQSLQIPISTESRRKERDTTNLAAGKTRHGHIPIVHPHQYLDSSARVANELQHGIDVFLCNIVGEWELPWLQVGSPVISSPLLESLLVVVKYPISAIRMNKLISLVSAASLLEHRIHGSNAIPSTVRVVTALS